MPRFAIFFTGHQPHGLETAPGGNRRANALYRSSESRNDWGR
jgi:hypothetical protein